jgi:ribosomal protein L22
MTEKQYAPSKTEKKMSGKVATPNEIKAAVAPKGVPSEEGKDKKINENKKIEETKEEVKKKIPVKKVVRDYAIVNVQSVPISTKYACGICKFIKGKTTGDAIRDLQDVLNFKKAIPMIGEYAHQKGKRMSGGKFPQDATKQFIILIKSLAANATANEINEPVITEAIPNQAARPMGRFGKWARKRTHVKLVAREKKKLKNLKIASKKGGKK